LIVKAPAPVIYIAVHCIIVCRGQEPVKKVCRLFVGVVWRYGSELELQRQLCLLVSNINVITKHVQDISVDAVSGCKFCSVLIYSTIYDINIFQDGNLSLSPLSQSGYQLGFSSKSFSSHHLSQHVSSAKLWCGRQTGMY
jgi:hypothetical protein